MTDSDRLAIDNILDHWGKGWQTKDAHLAAQDYSEDADWVNAFGMYCRGRDEIEERLSKIFGLTFVMAGRSTIQEQSIRFLRDDVALVSTRIEREGQLTASEEPLGTRHTRHLRVLVKFGDEWQIVSHLISDARERQRPQH